MRELFEQWIADGNVIKFNDGYATQDALYRNSVKDAGQDYEYHVIINYHTHEIKMICFEQGYINKTGSYVDKKRKLFEGTADEFIQFVKKEESTTP